MRITVQPGSGRNDGFGVTNRQIVQSLQRLGHEIVPDSGINLNFTHPNWMQYSDDKVDIIYFPWESTGMKDGWTKHLSLADQIWTTSPWVKEVVENWGYKVDQVYEHGVDPAFTNIDRRKFFTNGKFRILFQGFEAYRKGPLEAVRAFHKVFGNRDDVELVIKTQAKGASNFNVYNNITWVTEDLDLKQLVDLYHSCDLMLAPTYGEGFGLPGRDALATGMPLIATGGFLPYEELMHGDLVVPSKKIDSPWPDIHPGQMFKPDEDALANILEDAYQNYDKYLDHAVWNGKYVHKKYQWDELTEEAFFALSA